MTLAPRCGLRAERKMVEFGQQGRVRESRTAFQAATAADFVSAVEHILDRKVRAFASGVDPDSNVVFESFWCATSDPSTDAVQRELHDARALYTAPWVCGSERSRGPVNGEWPSSS